MSILASLLSHPRLHHFKQQPLWLLAPLAVVVLASLMIWQLYYQATQIRHLMVLSGDPPNQKQHQQLLALGALEQARTATSISYLLPTKLLKHPAVQALERQQTRFLPVARISPLRLDEQNPIRIWQELPQQNQIYAKQILPRNLNKRIYKLTLITFINQHRAEKALVRLQKDLPDITINLHQTNGSKRYWQLYADNITSRQHKDKLLLRLQDLGINATVSSRVIAAPP